LQGRIVNNNTFPVGSAPPTITSSYQSSSLTSSPSPPSTTPSTSTALAPSMPGSSPQSPASVPTQYLIHEEGGLERWFNLTIINIGIDSASGDWSFFCSRFYILKLLSADRKTTFNFYFCLRSAIVIQTWHSKVKLNTLL
jgi:hypothetical protein